MKTHRQLEAEARQPISDDDMFLMMAENGEPSWHMAERFGMSENAVSIKKTRLRKQGVDIPKAR